MAPLERLIFKFSGIDPNKEMNWKQHLKAYNYKFTVVILYLLLFAFPGHLPLNPDNNPSQTPDLHLIQRLVLSPILTCRIIRVNQVQLISRNYCVNVLHFVSAATGIAAMMVFLKP